MVDGSGDEEARLWWDRGRALIQRLNANDEYLRQLEERRREAGQLSRKELTLRSS